MPRQRSLLVMKSALGLALLASLLPSASEAHDVVVNVLRPRPVVVAPAPRGRRGPWIRLRRAQDAGLGRRALCLPQSQTLLLTDRPTNSADTRYHAGDLLTELMTIEIIR